MKIDTEILCSFIDGELDEQTSAAVQVAMETDENLRREYEDLRKTAELVRSLPKVPAPARLATTVTARTEREQLFGQAQSKTGRSKLYWSLSMAASLLVGVSLGVLGYKSWVPEQAPFEGPRAEIASVAGSDDYSSTDAPALALNAKGTASAKSSRSSGREYFEHTDRIGKAGKAAVTRSKSDLGSIPYANESRISRAGPKEGYPISKSVGSVRGAVADASTPVEALSPGGAMFQGQQAQQMPTRSAEALAGSTQTQQRFEEGFALETGGGQVQDELDRDELYRIAGVKERATQEEDARLRVVKAPPLERQVIANNFINRDMAVNLQFETEPVNVKVISNDSAKTLRYVQQWAANNSLVDLNEAPAELNFPVYAQVFYRGLPGKNMKSNGKNAVLVRTTRAQAQQMVNELQQQTPVVVSVSVKDEKRVLGNVLASRRMDQPQAQQDGPVWHGLADKDIAVKSELETKERQTETSLKTRARTPDQQYLYSLSNQAQVVSLGDLVSLVVLVEDAVEPAKTKAALPEAPVLNQTDPPKSPTGSD